MRELTKSMMSCTLAMSMFSLRQLMSLVTGKGGRDISAAGAFDQVAAAATGQMDETMRASFQAGDRWQRQIVDLIFVPEKVMHFTPGKWIEKITPSAGQAEQKPGPAAPADAAPAPPPPTWSWGAPRNATRAAEPQKPQPDSEASSPATSPAPDPGKDAAPQDIGWGPMP